MAKCKSCGKEMFRTNIGYTPLSDDYHIIKWEHYVCYDDKCSMFMVHQEPQTWYGYFKEEKEEW